MTLSGNLRSTAAPRGNYVLLTADTLRLLLPQHEVGAAEYLEGTLVASDEPGLLELPGSEKPRRFAALSAQMNLLPHCPPDRFLVTPLGDGSDDLGWCWSEVQILIDVELQTRPLPAVLLRPEAPVTQYAELDGQLAYLCGAQQLRAFVLAPKN